VEKSTKRNTRERRKNPESYAKIAMGGLDPKKALPYKDERGKTIIV